MAKRIGLVMGDEPLVETALLSRINAEPAVHAERVIIGGTAERHIDKHDVILDRISHLIPHYRSFLRAAALAGTNVVNDPFAISDDKFFALSLAARLGLNVPRTVLFPQKAYGPGLDPSRSLGNLKFPLEWSELAHYVGLPALLRPARATGMSPQRVTDVGAVIGAFDQTWDSPTMLQAEVAGARAHLRCICIGGESAVAVELGTYKNGHGGAGEGAFSEAIEAALRVSRALGLALNAVDVIVTATRAWVVDAVDPAPHLAPHTLGAEPFDTVLDRLAQHLVAQARTHGRTIDAHAWSRHLSSP